MTTKQWVSIVAALAAFFAPFLFPTHDLSVEGQRVLSILLLAVVLWVTELVPLHATAAVVILLEILLISDHAVLKLTEGFSAPSYRSFYATLADPVLMLFLGGFFLAHGAERFTLDRNLARVLLRPFGTSPPMVLMGIVAITALMSMFMSNTATTATMMAVVLPVIARLPAGDPLRTGLILAVPVAANIGGIGTPIGTPPNAIALGALARAGIRIGFLQWMLLAVPLMIVLLLLAWAVIARRYRSREARLTLDIDCRFDRSRSAVLFYVVFACTVALWMTEELHGMSSSIVGFFPVVVLLSTAVFSAKDLQGMPWHVLWLVAGGIALGVGVGTTGLDKWLIGLVPWEGLSERVITAVLAIGALALGTLISHSATANLLVPLAMSMGAASTIEVRPMVGAVFVAVGSSLAMMLPISTPPNAIAVSTGTVKTKDLALVGAAVGIVGWLLLVLVMPFLWQALGVMSK
ncbi:MAG: DASS family sodium-coupled anion symporter [Phycisphaerae bacterium]|nr:DASS family sodium-coupled anion symporter [Phycisphaerae bacterium]